jgi:SPP1 family predicted phage head-tail adaptor
MAFTAQELNRLIEFEEMQSIIDSHGEYVGEGWVSVGSAMAKVEPLVGREYIAAMAVQAEHQVKFTIRWRDDLKPTMRIVFDDKHWNIKSIQNVQSGNRGMLIFAEVLGT